MAYGDLCTLEDVIAELQITPIDADDIPLLQSRISSASDWIHTFCNRFFPIADYEEIRDGTGGPDMVFANPPVISVTSVNVDTVEIQQAPTAISAGYTFSPTRVSLRGFRFVRHPMNTVLRYTAGFAVIQPAVAQACVDFVVQRYRERSRVGVSQETIVGVDSFTYKVIADVLPNAKTALLQVRNVVPVVGLVRRLAPTPSDPALIVGVL